MDILYLLIGCSIAVALVFLGAFAWAVRQGQYADTLTPAHRMLLDEVPVPAAPSAPSVSHPVSPSVHPNPAQPNGNA